MKPKEFSRLRNFSLAKQLDKQHSFGIKQGRRTIKAKACHTGMWLKNSRIKAECSINKHFINWDKQ